MKTRMSAWMIAAALAGGSAASAWEGDEAEAALTVSVHVTDYANLPRKALAEAQAHATAAYRAAGLDVVWSSAPWSPDAESPSTDVSADRLSASSS